MTGASAPRREVRVVGERALLVECASLQDVMALHAALRAAPRAGQTGVLAAAATVMVRTSDPVATARLAVELAEMTLPAPPRRAGDGEADHAGGTGGTVVIDTVYDGEDLARVAELTGLSVGAVVRRHSSTVWTAAFAGFAPGFAYLVADDSGLEVPRRAVPRTLVPAGSVALAAGFSAVYPRAGPGGWQLIGRTAARLWQLDRVQPALVAPGGTVRFRIARDSVALAPPGTVPAAVGPPRPDAQPRYGAGLAVLATGAQSLVQDLGRPGYVDLGVSPSGAADRAAARGANRLVGSPRDAAVVETVLGGLVLRADGDHVLAVTGAPTPLTVREASTGRLRDQPLATPFVLRHGEVLELGTPPWGLRSYVGVRGGIDVPPVLGSRSTDLLSGIGPDPLLAGTVLPVGDPRRTTTVGHPEPALDEPAGTVAVQVVEGPRADWLTPVGLERLYAQEWLVTARSNRVGLRLAGEPLRRATERELPTEGMVAGAVQVPGSGQPVVFLPDHPVTGGYPVVAVVRDRHLDRLGQLRPGDRLRFTR